MLGQLNRKTAFSIVTIIFMGLSILKLSLLNRAYQVYLQEQMGDLDIVSQKQALVINHELEEYLLSGFALATIVNELNGNLSGSQFQSVAQQLRQQYPEIISFQLAPQGIVSQVYPENNAFIGSNYLSESQNQISPLDTIQSRQANLVGPVPWGKNDRLALVSQIPIFIDNQFWGLVLTAVWWDDFLTNVGLMNSSEHNYNYQLSTYNPQNGRQNIIWQSESKTSVNLVEKTINIPNSTKYLANRYQL